MAEPQARDRGFVITWPGAVDSNDGRQRESLWEGLCEALRQGLSRHIGVSNYSASQIVALERATKETPVVNQIEWSPFGHSDAKLEFCREENLQVGDFNLRAAGLAKLDALNERYAALGALPYE